MGQTISEIEKKRNQIQGYKWVLINQEFDKIQEWFCRERGHLQI